MVHENLPMEMSPEWKAITKCESRIEALEQKVDLLIVARISLTKRIIDHEERMQKLEQTIERHGEMLVEDEDRYDKLESVLKELSAKDEKPPEPFGMKGDFKREEVHQLILEAVKNGNNILIAEFIHNWIGLRSLCQDAADNSNEESWEYWLKL